MNIFIKDKGELRKQIRGLGGGAGFQLVLFQVSLAIQGHPGRIQF